MRKQRKRRGFSFRWKLVENYTAAAVGGLFLWFFINGVVNRSVPDFAIAILILGIAPFLVTFLDKKSSS